MKRVYLAVFATALFAFFMPRPASAMYEFCPASLKYDSVPASHQEPAALYGFELDALSSRTIASTKLAFDTSAGWYTVDVPSVSLAEKDRHYTGPSSTFVRHDYVSPVMYVRFPAAVTINHGWVYNAAALNDGAFGWQAAGNVRCDPPPAASPTQHVPAADNPFKLDAKDEDRLSAQPEPTSLVFGATASTVLETTACAQPFANAIAENVMKPAFPEVMRADFAGRAVVAVRVAIDADGTVRDAWTWAPSGYTAFDDAAVRAAKLSKYTGARSYCKAVPGSYLFRVTFAKP